MRSLSRSNGDLCINSKLDDLVILNLRFGFFHIGRANIAERLLREGADVVISDLSEERDARETEDLVAEAGRKAILLPGDIGEAKIAESVAWKAIEGFGTIDALSWPTAEA
jgi:hypothetical protein